MWGLTPASKRRRDELQGISTVKVNGFRYSIRKVNPFLDFEAQEIPQIFTHFQKRVEFDPSKATPEMLKRHLADMKRLVAAGLVDPKLAKDTLTIDDIFRWGDTGAKLYLEILAHSLNQFRGVRGVFFSIKIRQLLYTSWQNNMAKLRLSSFSPMEATP